jgi:hypothetical protein
MVTTGGPPSYVELLSCVEILRDARNIRNGDAPVARILRNSELVRNLRRSRDSEGLFRAMVIDNGKSRA